MLSITINQSATLLCSFLADRTATNVIGYWHHQVVRLSVCNAVHCGSEGWCAGLKAVGLPACSWQAISYLFLQTLLL